MVRMGRAVHAREEMHFLIFWNFEMPSARGTGTRVKSRGRPGISSGGGPLHSAESKKSKRKIFRAWSS